MKDAAGSGQGPVEAEAAPAIPAHRGVDYRRDIDGLRAVAVGLVLLYHSGLGLVRGGFIGVDVFFVISGYLITRVIATDIAHHRFSLFEFYRRRIKRLLPAYALVAAATLAVGWFISLPAHYRDTAQGVFSSAGYFSNIWLWHESGGYFAGQAEIKPMLHTWSLAVEEQFYIVFPLIMMGLVRLGAAARALRAVFILFFLASLVWAQWLLTRDASASFYLLPSRAWELMVGAALALGGLAAPARASTAAAQVGLGLLLIVASALLLMAGPHFPGVAALPACFGSLLVLQGGRVANGVSRLLLENGPMVFIGKISYSLYLWHWPLFAFYRYFFMAEPTVPVSLLLLALSVLFATASWAWVERPFRRRAALPGKWVVLFAMAASGPLMAASAVIQLGDGLPKRFSSEIQALYRLQQFDTGGCLNETAAARPPGQACVLGAAGVVPRVALWGDSHAYIFARPLEEVFRRRNLSFILYGYARCPPVLGVEPDVLGRTTGCVGYNAETLTRLLRDPSIGTVILSGRHALPMIGFYGNMESDEPAPVEFAPMAGLPDSPRDAAYLARMEATVRALVAGGKHVVLVMPVPEIGFDVPQAVGLSLMRHRDPDLLRIPREAYLRRQWQIRATLNGLARLPGVSLVDPGLFICPDESCHAVRNGVPMYFDDDHLSPDAVRQFLPQLLAAIGGAASGPPTRPAGRD